MLLLHYSKLSIMHRSALFSPELAFTWEVHCKGKRYREETAPTFKPKAQNDGERRKLSSCKEEVARTEVPGRKVFQSLPVHVEANPRSCTDKYKHLDHQLPPPNLRNDANSNTEL